MVFQTLLFAVCLVVTVGSWFLFALSRVARKREMRQFAEANGFELLGKKLPEGFLFAGTSIKDPEITNVMHGKLHGDPMVVFNASLSFQDNNVLTVQTQTVVAFPNVRRLGSRQIPPTGDTNLYAEVAGEWFVLYLRGTVIRKDQLADWCNAMRDIAQKLTAKASR